VRHPAIVASVSTNVSDEIFICVVVVQKPMLFTEKPKLPGLKFIYLLGLFCFIVVVGWHFWVSFLAIVKALRSPILLSE